MGVGGFFGGGNESKTRHEYDIDEERAESAGQLNLEPGDMEDGASVDTSVVQGVSASGGSDINIKTLDQGAISKAFKGIRNALGVVDKAGERNAETVRDTVDDSFTFAGGATNRAFDFAQNAMGRVSETAEAAAQQASNNMQAAVGAVRDTVSEQNETQQVIKGVALVGGIIVVGALGLTYFTKGK